MINKEEKKIEKIIEKNKNQTINDNESHNLIKKNLIELLETQLKHSKEKILEKEISSEKEIMTVWNRLNKEIEKTRKFSLEQLITDFLPIIDNIERSLNLIENNQSNEISMNIKNNLKKINTLLDKCFTLFNIKKIDEINVSFNPSIHQAMSIHYTDEIESNKIVTVMQPGYILNESRLLRPTMVMVSKKKT